MHLNYRLDSGFVVRAISEPVLRGKSTRIPSENDNKQANGCWFKGHMNQKD